MENSRKHFVWGGLAGAVAVVLLILLVGVAYAGAYDIAASSGHTPGMRWFLARADGGHQH